VTDPRTEIAELVNAWSFHRDQEAWDDLAACFADGGTISISWFDGAHADFVAASKRLAGGGSLLKHAMGVPRIRVNGERATSEANVAIQVRATTPFGEVDTTSFARFYDRLERRDGRWRIVKRTAIYERDRVDPVDRAALPEAFYAGLDRFPPPLRFLGASLERRGVPLQKSAVLDKSPQLAALYRDGDAWLAGR
jgi:hypothetical protein